MDRGNDPAAIVATLVGLSIQKFEFMPTWTKTDGEDEEKQAIRNKNVFYFILDFIRIIKCNQKKRERES